MRRSHFTAERPPPPQAPAGLPVVIGWELAAGLWRSPARPAQRRGGVCPVPGPDALLVVAVRGCLPC